MCETPIRLDRAVGRGRKLAEISLLAKSNKLGSPACRTTCFPQAPPLQCSRMRRAPRARRAVRRERLLPPARASAGSIRCRFPACLAVLQLCECLGWLDEQLLAREPRGAASPNSPRSTIPTYVEALRASDAAGRVEPPLRERYGFGNFENPLFPGVFERAATAVGGSILAAELALEGRVGVPSGRRHAPRPARPGERLLLLQRPGVRDPPAARGRRGARAVRGPRRASRRRRAGGVPRRRARPRGVDPRAGPLAAQRCRGRRRPRLRVQPAGAVRIQRQRARVPARRSGAAARRAIHPGGRRRHVRDGRARRRPPVGPGAEQRRACGTRSSG